MQTSDFDYDLPKALIAQTPAEPRDSARLMVLNRRDGTVMHRVVSDLPTLLAPKDLLVLNNTRVMKARLRGYKPTGGKLELLLLRRTERFVWEVMIGGKGVHPGMLIENIGDDPAMSAVVLQELEAPRWSVQFQRPILNELARLGEVPLPPYIENGDVPAERYQTVYADPLGSAAAPTAGLHFTPNLLRKLHQRGVETARVTLHVGLDTFAPVKADDVTEHRIHTEWCQTSRETAGAINRTQLSGGRVIAVGTTTVRTIETAARAVQLRSPGTAPLVLPQHRKEKRYPVSGFSGQTDLYITPGYEFKSVDMMMTNFHLPRTSLMFMVAAFLGEFGREKLLNAYEIAKREGYRFYSFGDAMLIV